MEEYDLKYNGGTVKIKYEPDPKARDIMVAVNASVDVSALATQRKLIIRPEEWINQIATRVIKEAPFNRSAILDLGFNDYQEICNFVAEKFPLVSFLPAPMQAVMGRVIDEEQLRQQITSTMSAPEALAGRPSK